MSQTRTALPSWLISLLLHMLLVLALGWMLRPPRQGAAAERTAEVGIVLKHQEADREFFESEDDAGQSSPQAPAATGVDSREELFGEGPPIDPSKAVPSSFRVIGPGVLESGGVDTARGAETAPHGVGRQIGGKGRTSVFGIEGEGYKFVYVFDRSSSMGAPGRNVLGAAKAELIASLKGLQQTHQFQIIFYNERPWRFRLAGDPNRLCFATEQNKALAAKFIGSITADGATNHERALLAAIKLQPDVIFFLTDADLPVLGEGQLAKIKRWAAGITIHAIEFGFGTQRQADNFLVKLARNNGGRHAYVDISRLSPVRRP